MLTNRSHQIYFINLKLKQLSRKVHTVVMIRHGESIWNVDRRFTGWCDVPLTKHGEADARDAGHLMGERGLKFDVAFTSNLERAWRTCAMVLAESGQSGVETIKSWKLNERHYGALQGHKKNCPKLTASFGEEKLIEWRRSYQLAPPTLYDPEIFNRIDLQSFKLNASHMDPRFIDHSTIEHLLGYGDLSNNIAYGSNNSGTVGEVQQRLQNQSCNTFFVPSHSYPSTESLKDCGDRAYGYWKQTILPRVKAGERVLIVAHANTIRALVKAVDNISDNMIRNLKIPNGIPLVYTLDENLEPIQDQASLASSEDTLGFQAKYLVSARNHQKMMQYEKCTRRKLRALFEYLDRDRDGRISRECLFHGLMTLQGYQDSIDDSVLCEYSIEEILRCVPKADELGGITLESFLESEKTLLPKLTRLKLLA